MDTYGGDGLANWHIQLCYEFMNTAKSQLARSDE